MAMTITAMAVYTRQERFFNDRFLSEKSPVLLFDFGASLTLLSDEAAEAWLSGVSGKITGAATGISAMGTER